LESRTIIFIKKSIYFFKAGYNNDPALLNKINELEKELEIYKKKNQNLQQEVKRKENRFVFKKKIDHWFREGEKKL